eukprot:gene6028-3209_t
MAFYNPLAPWTLDRCKQECLDSQDCAGVSFEQPSNATPSGRCVAESVYVPGPSYIPSNEPLICTTDLSEAGAERLECWTLDQDCPTAAPIAGRAPAGG